MLSHINPSASSETGKRKRRPAGTPDPDAEVVSLSPKTLLESDQYVCEICNQGFQRDQNLQMHRRRHKVPWKLLKHDSPTARKRVYVCPEPSCFYHDPSHALGDLVGIKKHFRRKHSDRKQWVCEKCGKGYAVQSDYKAHLKTCGTRGHSCDCGRVFSRVESFIEHQDACNVGRIQPESHHNLHPTPTCLSQTASSQSPSMDTILSTGLRAMGPLTFPKLLTNNVEANPPPNLELQLLSTSTEIETLTILDDDHSTTQLQLSIGSSDSHNVCRSTTKRCSPRESTTTSASEEQLRMAIAEKDYAEQVRREAKQAIELVEWEFAEAKRIRQQALAELEKAYTSREQATKQVNSILFEITCHSCKNKFQQQC